MATPNAAKSQCIDQRDCSRFHGALSSRSTRQIRAKICLRKSSRSPIVAMMFTMPKLLPDDDFRAKRVVLTREDFAYAPKLSSPPSDVICSATWESIVTLPDDVAVRTSNYHGTALRQLNDLWGAWIESPGSTQDSLSA